MPVKYLFDKIAWPAWASPRYKQLDFLERFLTGKAYDHLSYPFYQEVQETGRKDYIPLRERRPSVIYNIPKIVVSRSVSMLFAGNHWPKIYSNESDVTDFFQDLTDKTNLAGTMLDAAYWGSLGSVAVLFSIVNGKVLYEVWNAKYCKPIFAEDRELLSLTIFCVTDGWELEASGFEVPQEFINDKFFYIKKYTTTEEIIYEPVRCEDYDPKDTLKPQTEIKHDLGFVPGVWIRNYPISQGIDADSTFCDILNIVVEIDYQLSQTGRGLKYNADPQLLIKEPPGDEQQYGLFDGTSAAPKVRSTSNALFVGEGGDAKLLEISGQGQKAVIEFVKLLRQYALEIARGSRKEPEKSYGNMSGRAMEILEEDLISFAAVLRISYGDQGLKPLLIKIAKAAKKIGLVSFNPDSPDFSLNFIWGNWFDPTPSDLLQTEQASDIAVKSRRLFMSEARALSAAMWGVGHSDVEVMDEEWPLPPQPELPDLILQQKAIDAKPAANPQDGDNRRGA